VWRSGQAVPRMGKSVMVNRRWLGIGERTHAQPIASLAIRSNGFPTGVAWPPGRPPPAYCDHMLLVWLNPVMRDTAERQLKTGMLLPN
jgi:hypothetical protein